MNTYPARTPWPANFPDVIIHCELRDRNTHPAYKAAKAGDITAAEQLVDDLLSPDSLQAIAQLIGTRKPLLVPVAAVERGGFNAIPDEMAHVLASEFGLQTAPYDLNQLSYVAHTRANGWHRLVTPAVLIAVLHDTLSMLQKKHGEELNNFWRQVFRYGTDCLTNIEAGYLCRVESVASINARMAAAAADARRQGLPAIRLSPGP